MAMYEVFYASRLYDTRKAIKRFKEDDYKKGLFSKKKRDEDAIRSLFGMNDGRKNMRKALGMDMDTPAKEAIQKFWLLGEFLEMGEPIELEKLDKNLKKRKKLLQKYKAALNRLSEKLEEKQDESKN